MKLYPWILMAMLSFSASAQYTVTWEPNYPPVVDGWHLWCIPAGNTYGSPNILPEPDRQYVGWANESGTWKCKMASYLGEVTSVDSNEVFFEMGDANGDGNLVVISAQPPTINVPCVGCSARSAVMDITRKGYWTILGPDGTLLQTAPGEDQRDRQTTSVLESVEWITKDGRMGTFTIQQPNYEVTYESN